MGYQQQTDRPTRNRCDRPGKASPAPTGRGDTARIAAERPAYQFNPPDPIFGGGSIIEAPRRPGVPPTIHPWPGAPATPAPVIPGPQSELQMAYAEPRSSGA